MVDEGKIIRGRVADSVGRRLRVLMLCAHEPTVDPRIRWEAEGATTQFDVTVLGFNRAQDPLPALEPSRGYTIRRVPHVEVSALHYFRRLAETLDPISRVTLIVLGVVFFPLLALLELCFRVLRTAYRNTKEPLDRHVPTLLRIARTMLAWIRSTRAAYVMALLRAQFAPPTLFFWNAIVAMRDKPDIVHCNDLDTLLVGVLAKKHFGSRVVYDAHEYFPHSDPNGRWLDRAFFHALEKTLARKADSVITVNHQMADVIRTAYGLPSVESVPNAEPWTGCQVFASCSRMRTLARGRVSVLFQGRFSPGRGIEEVLEAWKHVDPSLAVLFLRGPDNIWRRDLVSQAERLGILDVSVHFLDSVGEDDLISAAAEADVGLIPYKGEVAGYKYACPNKLSQYLHAGLMIITNDLPYVREVIEEADAGLHYSLSDSGTLVEVVHRIARNPDLLKRARANARRYAREKFNWQVFSPTLYDAYRSDRVVAR